MNENDRIALDAAGNYLEFGRLLAERRYGAEKVTCSKIIWDLFRFGLSCQASDPVLHRWVRSWVTWFSPAHDPMAFSKTVTAMALGAERDRVADMIRGRRGAPAGYEVVRRFKTKAIEYIERGLAKDFCLVASPERNGFVFSV